LRNLRQGLEPSQWHYFNSTMIGICTCRFWSNRSPQRRRSQINQHIFSIRNRFK